MNLKSGTVVKAAHDITSHLGSTTVYALKGTPLMVSGESGNALHPISVRLISDPGCAFAVSEQDIEEQ
jgi:hypothetical protein